MNRLRLIVALATLAGLALATSASAATIGGHHNQMFGNSVYVTAHDGEDNKLTIKQSADTELTFAERGAIFVPSGTVSGPGIGETLPNAHGLHCRPLTVIATCPAAAPAGIAVTFVNVDLGDGSNFVRVAGEFNDNILINIQCGPGWDHVVVESASASVGTSADCTVVDTP